MSEWNCGQLYDPHFHRVDHDTFVNLLGTAEAVLNALRRDDTNISLETAARVLELRDAIARAKGTDVPSEPKGETDESTQ